MTNILQLSALKLASLVKNKSLSPLEIVDAHIAQIEKVNPRINAVIVKCFEEARAQAKKQESCLDHEQPLFGVPFTVKEILAVKGKPHTMSCLSYKNRVASKNATVVDRIKSAGAILLGLTNLPEIAFGLESDNLIYGRTNHPKDIKRIPGGSSGGEAAIIASGGSPFGIGSDAGGSIRMPSFYCGIYGHKPSSGIIPITGHHPLDDISRSNFSAPKCITVGPMTRSAEDLMLLTNIMSGADGIDKNVKNIASLQQCNFSNRTILLCEDPQILMARKPAIEIVYGVRQAGRILESMGANVEYFNSRKLRRAFQMWMSIFSTESEQSLCQTLGNDQKIVPFTELIKYIFRRPNHSIECIFFAIGEQLLNVLGSSKKKYSMLKELESLRMYLQDYLQDKVLILPTLPHAAPKHKGTLLFPFDFTYSAIFNALGFPATAIPMGKNKQGFPIGVQAVASHGRDDLTISTAIAIEKVNGNPVLYLD